MAVGLVYAAELAWYLGRIDDARVDEHYRVLAEYGLSAAVPPGLDPDELLTLMGRDKKAVGGLTFVLDGPGGVEVVRRRRPRRRRRPAGVAAGDEPRRPRGARR